MSFILRVKDADEGDTVEFELRQNGGNIDLYDTTNDWMLLNIRKNEDDKIELYLYEGIEDNKYNLDSDGRIKAIKVIKD